MAEGRGGMSKNSFGGRKRLDHLDLMKFRPANTSPEKMLYLATIQDAAQNYLFYGLGRNGTSPDEFLAAYNYFFLVRSSDPTTWPIDMPIVDNEQEGSYTLGQIKAMCFDTHFEHSGLRELLPFTAFVQGLMRTRLAILNENWLQVIDYFKSMTGYSIGQTYLKSTLISPNINTLSNLIRKRTPESNEPAKVSSP